MKHVFTDEELEKLSDSVARYVGSFFPRSKWRYLEMAFSTAAKELGYRDMQECAAWFTASTPSKEIIESMACYLTIGETYFFREPRCFEVLERQIIPEIVSKRSGGNQRLRIWSSGCATGEEAYSIAIVLHRMRDLLRDWDVTILATDINPHSLRKAREAVYTDWSFRNPPTNFKKTYFSKTGCGRFELLPNIKEMVTFASCNLAEEWSPPLNTGANTVDVIFCRNVLMYLEPQRAGKIVERFHHCLLEGGWLFVSPCEVSNPFFSRFDSVTFPDAILHRKPSGGGLLKPESSVLFAPFPTGVRGETARRPLPLPIPERHTEMPVHQESLESLCRTYANEGKLTEALAASDQALAADKLCAGLHYLRAVILQEQGLNYEAATALKKALYLEPDMVLAYFTLAALEQRNGKVAESRRHFDTALLLLDRYHQDDEIPESGGILAGRLKEIIRTTNGRSEQELQDARKHVVR
jgi:chemotaxis protein methyltransferase CheR